MIRATFDTSTNEAVFVLFKNDEEIFSVTRECQRGASKLLPWINASIKESGYHISDVEQWLVGKGPGSFTGIRVGIAFVKGVCFGSGAVYKGINSGFAYLYPFIDREDISEITVLHDGRKSEVICNKFIREGQAWLEEGVEVLRVEDLRPELFKGPLVTQMDLDTFPEGIRPSIESIISLRAGHLREDRSAFPDTKSAMEASCEPIYVRPAVFVQPAKKK
jgi:tRNA threonylcarbamoyl adenosine modification protein YeaZ